jgi:hypothetical protein
MHFRQSPFGADKTSASTTLGSSPIFFDYSLRLSLAVVRIGFLATYFSIPARSRRFHPIQEAIAESFCGKMAQSNSTRIFPAIAGASSTPA